MKPGGRPRLTPEDLDQRIAVYCATYGEPRGADGLPPFPTGQRETDQHREWLKLYKAHQRLARRLAGACQRCGQPVVDDTSFCGVHQPEARSASPQERHRLLGSQAGSCPICARELDPARAVVHERVDPPARTLLHLGCRELVRVAQELGPDTLDRTRTYLWKARGGRGR